ncbi:MAG: hypothetical protein ACOC1S_02400, partial [bacterium]
YMALILACYVSVLFIILQGTLSPGGMMVVVTLIYAINNLQLAFKGINNLSCLADLDEKTAKLHFFFGVLWIISVYFFL